nr:hypothetical protein [uncultured Aminipila sp.]
MKKIILIIILINIFSLYGCNSPPSESDYYKNTEEVNENTYEKTGEYTYDDIYDAYCDGWNEACEEVFCDYDELYYDDYMYCLEDYYDFVDGEPWLDESYSDTELPYIESDYEEAYLQGRESALETIFCDTRCFVLG